MSERSKGIPDSEGIELTVTEPLRRNSRPAGGGYGRTEDVSLGEPRPFPVIVDWMDKGELVLAVQGFGHGTGFGADHAQTVIGEIAAVSGVNTDHGRSPPYPLVIGISSLAGSRRAKRCPSS